MPLTSEEIKTVRHHARLAGCPEMTEQQIIEIGEILIWDMSDDDREDGVKFHEAAQDYFRA